METPAYSPKHILVVDADAVSRQRIVDSLDRTRFVCRQADSAQAALSAAGAQTPDLVILELYLPDLSGLGLCRVLRETPALASVPLLVVTAQAGEIDRVLAFEAGADDFLAKPFYPPELAARVRAVLRGFARGRDARMPEATSKTVQVDLERGRAEVRGRQVDLTPTELQILAALLSRVGRVVRRRDLIERLWGPEAPLSDRAIDAHVKSIRRKLGDARSCLETVRGVGYRFAEPT